MDNAWAEGAASIEFMGVKQTDLHGKMTAITTKEDKRADLQSQLDMLDAELDNDYLDLDATRVSVGNGVRGDKDYGDDSPLYGAMGFVRKSARASGLTRKPRTSPTK